MYTDTTRQRIKYFREQKNITQEELAQKLNMDKRSYQRIESGEKKIVDVDIVYRIAETLGITPFDLLPQENLNIGHIDHNNIVGIAGTTVFANNDITEQYGKILAEKDKIILELKGIIALKDKLLDELKKD